MAIDKAGTNSIFKLYGIHSGSILLLEWQLSSQNDITALHLDWWNILNELFSCSMDSTQRNRRVLSIIQQLESIDTEALYPDYDTRCCGIRDPNTEYDARCCESTRIKKVQSSHPRLFMTTTEPEYIGISSHTIREDGILVHFIDCDIAAVMRPVDHSSNLVATAFAAKRLDEKERKVSVT